MTDALPARRLLLVHAHPDDETIGTGATMAHYADAGALELVSATVAAATFRLRVVTIANS